MVKPLPSPLLLREFFDYSPATGALRWRPDIIHRWAGKPAFTTRNAEGQHITRFAGHTLIAPRAIWALVHGTWPAKRILCLDGDTSNLTLDNLAEAPTATARADWNAPGVEWCGNTGRWTYDGELFPSFLTAYSTMRDAKTKRLDAIRAGHRRLT